MGVAVDRSERRCFFLHRKDRQKTGGPVSFIRGRQPLDLPHQNGHMETSSTLRRFSGEIKEGFPEGGYPGDLPVSVL